MTWQIPETFVTGEVVSATKLNQNVRDNVAALQPQNARVATSETTASASFTDLATTGPSVALNTGTAVTVIIGANVSNNTTGSASAVGVAVSGATTLAAADARSLTFTTAAANQGATMSRVVRLTGLTAGANTFTLKYRVSGNTGTFSNRDIDVVAA